MWVWLTTHREQPVLINLALVTDIYKRETGKCELYFGVVTDGEEQSVVVTETFEQITALVGARRLALAEVRADQCAG